MFIPDVAIILAAGLGSRLNEYTRLKPKPLIEIGGFSCLERAIQNLISIGIKKILVNTHYMAELIAQEVAKLRNKYDVEINILYEEEILETGGGILNAMNHANIDQIFVHNGDVIIENFNSYYDEFIQILSQESQAQTVCLVQDKNQCRHNHPGDFDFSTGRKLIYSNKGAYIWSGFYLINREILKHKNGRFPVMECIIPASINGWVYGVIHQDEWIDIGIPERLLFAMNKYTPSYH